MSEDPLPQDPSVSRRCAVTVRLAGHPLADLAVVELADPVPDGVAAARLRCPKPADVVGRTWWAFGFPNQDPRGNEAAGTVGASLGYGWVRLDTTTSPNVVAPGFSGGGLWCPDYGAVVGVVSTANGRGDAQAITLHQADGWLPAENIRVLTQWTVEAADEVAQAAWGWTLAQDKEADRHWRPRARGVSVAAERGHRFRGRRTALAEIVAWLDRPAPDRKVLVITGSPGVGKSAVLGRIVTTADAEMRAALPPEDDAVRADVGSVACAVHAKGKTALDVAMEIARAASAPLPDRVDDLPTGLRDALAERGGQRFTLVIDALDEASDPTQARAIITGIVLPIAAVCAEVGAQVAVGTRRSDEGGDLLRVFGPARITIDLDDSRYFDLADLAAYVQATLQLHGDERRGNPYQPDEVAAPVAARIAELAEQNFLIAGLVARTHGLYDDTPISPSAVAFTPSVESTLATFLDRLPPVGTVPARDLLTALAFAEAPGLPSELWQLAVQALTGTQVSTEQLSRLARGSAANFLVESTSESATAAFRLFHQALNDVLSADRARSVPPVADDAALTWAFTGYGTRIGWNQAPAYLFRSLPAHALRAGMIDELLADTDYVLHADLRRLIPAAAAAVTPAGMQRAHALRLTPRAIAAGPPQRLALLSVTETLDDLGTAFRHHRHDAPYRGRWANALRRKERAVLEGHTSGINGVCAVRVDARELLVSAGDDGTVQIWDPATGAIQFTLEGHTGGVAGLCALQVAGRELLASAGNDGAVLVWDPATGARQRNLHGHTGRVRGVCAVRVDGQDLLASAGDDGTVRIWDLATGAMRCAQERRNDAVVAVCAVRVQGRELLASASAGTVRLRDPVTGEPEYLLEEHTSGVTAVCALQIDSREMLVSAGEDGTVWVWDLATGDLEYTLKVRADGVWGMRAVCAVRVDGRELLASASDDGTVRVWDPATGATQGTQEQRIGWVTAVCAVQVDGRELLASAGKDGTVRVWDPATGITQRTQEGSTGWVRGACAVLVGGRELLAFAGDGTMQLWDPATGHLKRTMYAHWFVRTWDVCVVQVDGRELLAFAGDDGTVQVWDPATRATQRILEGHKFAVHGVCAVRVDGRELLASAGDDGTVRIWDPATGATQRILQGHKFAVHGVCAVRVDGRELLASAGDDGTVRIWDPATGASELALQRHTDSVWGVCMVRVRGRELLASASIDRTVRIWDPATGRALCVIPVHYEALELTSFDDGTLIVGLSAGLLALSIT